MSSNAGSTASKRAISGVNRPKFLPLTVILLPPAIIPMAFDAPLMLGLGPGTVEGGVVGNWVVVG